MNPVLIVLILLSATALWFLLSFIFYPLGKLCYRIFKDAADEINHKEKGEESNER